MSRRVAIALGLAPLLLFVDKPVHLDEPVYLAVAEQILRAPLDFYGFEMNWTGAREPVIAENMNPPGVAFLLAALVTAVLAWPAHAWQGKPGLAPGIDRL